LVLLAIGSVALPATLAILINQVILSSSRRRRRRSM